MGGTLYDQVDMREKEEGRKVEVGGLYPRKARGQRSTCLKGPSRHTGGNVRDVVDGDWRSFCSVVHSFFIF